MLTKKSTLKKIKLSVLSAVLAFVIPLSSCAAGRPVAMTLTYGENTTTLCSNIYSYYLSYMKTTTLANLYMSLGKESIEDIISMGDFPEYWNTKVSETETLTIGEAVKMQAEEIMMQFLAIEAYCKENKLELSKEEKKNIDSAINELIKSDKYKGSTNALNTILSRFNIDDKILREIKQMENLTGVFSRHAFDAQTGKAVTPEMINTLYSETCARVKHIILFNNPGTKDAEGNAEQFTEEELAERKAKIEDIYEKIQAGEDLENFIGESDDTQMPEDGYTFGMNSVFIEEVIEAMFDMKVGEVRMVESAYGTHIIKKYELLPIAQALDINSSQSQGSAVSWESSIDKMFRSYMMAEILRPYMEKIEINTEETDSFSTALSDLMFDCMEIMQ